MVMNMTDSIKKTLDKIHSNSLRILSELGMEFHSAQALDILRDAGVRIEGARAYFSEAQVMEALDKVKKDFVLRARNPKYDSRICPDTLHITPGYGSASVSALDGSMRSSVFADFLKLAEIVHVSEQFSINGGILAQPGDIKGELSAPAMVYATIKKSDKAVLSVSANAEQTQSIMDMLKLVFGADDLDKDHYCLTLISSMSPLSIDKNAIESLTVCARHNQPVIMAPGPMAGGTGPISLAGNISLANAEILAGIVLAQAIRPGLPMVYGFAATTSDMRNMQVSNASPGFLSQARYGAMLAKRYGLPCRSGGGMSDAGGLTAQAGVESAMGLFESFSQGANLVMHATGSLHSFSTVNYEKFIMDIETVDRLRYYYSDIPDDDEALAFDALKNVLESGSQFMLSEHTLMRCREDPWEPMLSLHGRSSGEPNAELYGSIAKKLADILDEYKKPTLGPETEKALDDYMRGLGLEQEFIDMI